MRVKSTLITHSPSQTSQAGESLARELLKAKRKDALVVGLEGDLGGGKTTFLQGFAKGLGVKGKILSPTFIIMRRLKIQNPKSKIQNFYHLDCYRVGKPRELLELGFKNIVSNPENIVAIEWVDRVRGILPKKLVLVKFKFVGSNTRKITIERRTN